MPAAIPIAAVVVSALAAGGSAIEANQQIQHAKGAAQAEATAAQGQIDTANKQDQDTQAAKGSNASATQSAAIAALRASMSGTNGFGGSILTSGQGTNTAVPTTTKSLLGA